MRKRIAIVAAACAAMVLIGAVTAVAALAPSYNWYLGHESDTRYELTAPGQLIALSDIVNGTADTDGDGEPDIAADDFSGKTIVLTGGGITGSYNFANSALTPIGTAEHPFKGAFDGQGKLLDNFTISSTSDADPCENIGFFGYVGEGGSISNVRMGSHASVTVTRDAASKQVVKNVGLLVGHCGGSMTGCSTTGSVTVESAALQASERDYAMIRNVGGLAGECVFDVAGCTNAGRLYVLQSSSPVSAYGNSTVASAIGGIVGFLGDSSRLGDWDAHYPGDSSLHGSISGCTNTGEIHVDTPNGAGLDRFGSPQTAESLYVGGVVGYSQGSVTDCVNGSPKASAASVNARDTGYINAQNAAMAGGVCGSLRGVRATNVDFARMDDGSPDDELVISNCRNYGDVVARVTAGGIVGKAGSYTSVTQCVNDNRESYYGNKVSTYVIATRWNKPTPGGIVGSTYGNVSYCANLGNVASALWSDHSDEKTITKAAGYYAAGIAGALTYFEDKDEATGEYTAVTPIPEIYGCYNAGNVIAVDNMRQRGIVGNNEGYVHDNVLVKGTVYRDKVAYGDAPEDTEASGTVGENLVLTADELRSEKTAEALTMLNRNCEQDGWEVWWVSALNTAAGAANDGFPYLSSDGEQPWTGDNLISIRDAEVSLAKNAEFTGSESVPEANVTVGGAALAQNVDFRVIPQAGAVEPSTGGAYRAQIVGIGKYTGTAAAQLSYDIEKGDLANCVVSVAAKTFNYEVQLPAAGDVRVMCSNGAAVDPSEYSFEIVDEKTGAAVEPVNADSYTVRVTADPASDYFYGTLDGIFRVKPASFRSDVDFADTTIEFLGESHPWVDSTKSGESENPSTVLPYTGVSVQPVVTGVTYRGHELVEGVDYKVIYGNTNSDDGYTGSYPQNNVGIEGGTSVGCVTIRYISGKRTNFSSYANMFFRITDDGTPVDLSKATYEAPEQLADGSPLEPVRLFLGSYELREGKDYSIAYRDNVEPGIASFTATGLGRFSGTLEGTFEIKAAQVYEVLFAYADDGTAAVTGVEYHGSREGFALEIPGEVEHEGAVYTVTAIADHAFGGTSSSEFTGSLANESKHKVTSVTIPASVTAIGEYAFGYNGNQTALVPPLESVTFEDGSSLTTIGKGAFQACKSLETFTFPAEVDTIGANAFQNCESLKELCFMTRDADKPSSVATGATTGAFRNMSGVTVRGYESAATVKALAEGNAGAKAGVNAGMKFVFEPYDESFGDIVIAPIEDQTYTGSPLTPAVSVSLDGAALVEGTDYVVSYASNVNVGTALVTVTGIKSYVGSAGATFEIKPLELDRRAEIEAASVMYSGQAVDLRPTVIFCGAMLDEGVDFAVSYADEAGNPIDAPVEVGGYRIVVSGIGNYAGSNSRQFSIIAASLDNASIDYIPDQAYTGEPVEPAVVVRLAGAVLERGVDYEVSYDGNVEIGEATATVTGIGGYSGAKSAGFAIVDAVSIRDAVVSDIPDVVATGEPIEVNPVVILDGAVLTKDVDYRLMYRNSTGSLLSEAPKDKGSYQIELAGLGRYRESCFGRYSIVDELVPDERIDVSAAEVTVVGGPFVFNGSPQMPEVKAVAGERELVAGVDFAAGYAGNTGAGTARVVVVGIGECTGANASAIFEIAKGDIAAAEMSIGQRVYTGAAIEPGLDAASIGETDLIEGVDYEIVSYADNVMPGDAAVHVRGIGENLEGEADVPFGIVSADASALSEAIAAAEQKPAGVVVSEDGMDVPPSTMWTTQTSLDALDRAIASAREVAARDPLTEAEVATAAADLGSATEAFDASVMPGMKQEPRQAEWPTVASGLVYDGKVQAGVVAGEGWTVSSGAASAVDAGTYVAHAHLDEGWLWPDGTSGDLTLEWKIAPAQVTSVTLTGASATYNGKAHKPAVKVVKAGTLALAASDYTVTYLRGGSKTSDFKTSGKIVVKVAGKGNYAGIAQATYTINKASGKLAVTAKASTAKTALAASSSKGASFTASKYVKVGKKTGTLTYDKANKAGGSKITVASKTGKITVKKGLKKTTYTVKVKLTSAASTNYKAVSQTVTVKVKVS